MNPSAAHSTYIGEGSKSYHHEKRSVPDQALPWVIRSRSRLFQPHIQPTDHVLEWGCGFGWNLAGLRCSRRCGYDLASQLEGVVQSLGVEFLCRTQDIPDGSFQVVLCHHVLEHVPDPLMVLAEIRRLLSPSGKLLLAVPFERHRRYRHYDPAEPNHHLFSWNVQTLGNLLQVAGYRVQQIGLRSYGYERRAAQWAVRWKLGEAGYSWLRRLIWVRLPIHEIAAVASPSRE